MATADTSFFNDAQRFFTLGAGRQAGRSSDASAQRAVQEIAGNQPIGPPLMYPRHLGTVVASDETSSTTDSTGEVLREAWEELGDNIGTVQSFPQIQEDQELQLRNGSTYTYATTNQPTVLGVTPEILEEYVALKMAQKVKQETFVGWLEAKYA